MTDLQSSDAVVTTALVSMEFSTKRKKTFIASMTGLQHHN